MATAKRAPSPAPTVFVLFGATGDLAKRMVLPAFSRLALEGLLPRQWRLVGNGRGDVAHEDFRGHVHDVLTEFGPQPEPGPWKEFAQNVFFAGGGFSTDSPGSLLDVLGHARESLGGDLQLVHYLAVPPVAFTGLTRALGQHNLAEGARVFTRPDGLAAVWKVAEPLLCNPPRVASYPQGSWGPAQARKLIAPGRWLLGQ